MRFQKIFPIIAISACLLFLSGCILNDSPAPGCRETIGIPMMGGCSGKTAIVDLEVESAPECVVIEANNCNGGVLQIRNTCSEALSLDKIVIDPSDSISLDVKEVEGSIEMIAAHGNFSEYIPEDDTRIELTGVVGLEPIKFAFTKTKPLCK